ncbi:MAG: TIGR00296 family protein [Candidatus Micrarchaeota archaeon]
MEKNEKLLPLKQGAALVKSARRAIEEELNKKGGGSDGERGFEPKLEKRGVFVTIETFPQRELRGCIGFPEPTHALDAAVREAALSAAFGDPRFPPVQKKEFESVTVEISVLTPPELLEEKNPEEIPRKIKIGRDGLIIQRGYASGLLLPIVPVEWGWSAAEFLEHLCDKAGLPRGSWKDKGVRLFVFESQVFREKTPRGEVEEVNFSRDFGVKKRG